MELTNTVVSGSVRCGRIVHFRSKEPNKTHPIISGYTNINVTSANKTFKVLSPMKLGSGVAVAEALVQHSSCINGFLPGCVAAPGNMQQITITNLENFWQGSKIYNIDTTTGVAPTSISQIKDSFFLRRATMCADPKPHRRALKTTETCYPVAAYFTGAIYSYVQSRIFYIKLYEKLAAATPMYQHLQQRLAKGENLHIIGYDGRDVGAITAPTLEQQMYYPNLPFGHELVLCGMLSGVRPWEKWKW